MKRSIIYAVVFLLFISKFAFGDSAVDNAVNNFFGSIASTSDIQAPTMVQNQSAGVLSLGGVATRSQLVNLDAMHFTPPSFDASCGNMNFYSGSLAFMTNTDQLVQFMQNTLMTAGITAVMTALKAVTPNIAGTLQSMFDASQKMLNMFNTSCQLGMALGNSTDSWMYDRLGKAKSQAHSDSSDASSAEINSTTGGSSGSDLATKMQEITKKYQEWVQNNANMNPFDKSGVTTSLASKYGSVIWKGMQALHLYSLPIKTGTQGDVSNIANLVISLTGDLIIYSPGNDGTGTQARVIPPAIQDIKSFMATTTGTVPTYSCTYFNPDKPGECTPKFDISNDKYPPDNFNGGVMKKIQDTMKDIQNHFTSSKTLSQDDYMIISISPIPIYAIAQTLDDIGMQASISSILNQYSEQIAYEILQRLISVALNLAIQSSSTRSNNDTQQTITGFTKSITNVQNQVNSYASKYVTHDPVDILQRLNYLRAYAQNQMSGGIMQKVNFAKQLSNY